MADKVQPMPKLPRPPTPEVELRDICPPIKKTK